MLKPNVRDSLYIAAGALRTVGLAVASIAALTALWSCSGPAASTPPARVRGSHVSTKDYLSLDAVERDELLGELRNARDPNDTGLLCFAFENEPVPGVRYSAALALATHPSEDRDKRVLAHAHTKGFDPVVIATALTSPQTPAASAYLRKIAGRGDEDSRVTAWKSLSPSVRRAEVDLAEKRLPVETEWVQLEIALALIRSRDAKGVSFVKSYASRHPNCKWKRNVELALERQKRSQ